LKRLRYWMRWVAWLEPGGVMREVLEVFRSGAVGFGCAACAVGLVRKCTYASRLQGTVYHHLKERFDKKTMGWSTNNVS